MNDIKNTSGIDEVKEQFDGAKSDSNSQQKTNTQKITNDGGITTINSTGDEHKDYQQRKHFGEIEKIEHEILIKFKHLYDEDFATTLLFAFDKVIKEEEFNEVELIGDDIEDPATSAILESIWNDIEQHLKNQEKDKKRIIKGLQDIINNKYKSFNIKTFTFTVRQKDVNEATKLVQKCASIIYNTSDPTACNNGMNINIAEDKSLCIAKAVDLKNGYPILKWLLDSFSRDRVIGHKILFENFGTTFDKYPFDTDKYATGYNPTTWWLHDSAFCKYIQYKNAKMALPLMTAVQALSKRALPQLNFNSQLAPVIHDNLNDFAKYTFASWHIAHKLLSNIDVLDAAIQIDFWIIPQLVKPRKLNPMFGLKELLYDDDDSDTEGYDALLSRFNLDAFHNYSENRYNKMGKTQYMKKVKCALWDLEQYLKKAGYVKNKDYWSQYAEQNLVGLQDQLDKMLNSVNDNKNVIGRYIFIFDRRNPENLKHENMGYKKPNYFKTAEKDWADKIILFIPKKQSRTTNLASIPELLWCHSKEFLFPNGEHDEHKEDSIGISDNLNGYKWILSYHLLKYNSSSIYWFMDQGSEKFEFQDMEWLFTRYFTKINDEEQTLNDENVEILRKWMKQKRFVDDAFDTFWKQCHSMIIVHHK